MAQTGQTLLLTNIFLTHILGTKKKNLLFLFSRDYEINLLAKKLSLFQIIKGGCGGVLGRWERGGGCFFWEVGKRGNFSSS